MTRGFFSVILATFAVVFLIGVIYSQSVRDANDARANHLLVLQQELSKDWFMARNAYSNFAADAMASAFEQVVPAANCAFPGTPLDFAPAIQDEWNKVYVQLYSKGIDCRAVLSNSLYNDFEPVDRSALQVFHGERAYGVLDCHIASSGIDFNMTQPFVIKKEFELSHPAGAPTNCRVRVMDTLGIIAPATPTSDVDVTYSAFT